MVTETKTEIRIYVASLADYNGGILHGAWINANQDPESIKAEVAAMLAESHEPGAEEWAIHDYEGFEGLRLGEWESFEKIAELAEALGQHGEAFALYAANVGTEYAEVDGFLDSYQGQYCSMAEFAEEWHTETGDIDPSNYLVQYIDWERVGRDMECDGYWESDGHIFAS
jgi:antirestriction protein